MAEKTKKLEVELFQVLERTSSAKLDKMVNLQKSTSDRTGLGYGFSSSNIASTSTIIFVPPSDNVEIENNDVKTDLASKNIDKGKSLGLRRLTLKSLNKRSNISVIIVELPVILNQIAISV